MEPKPRFHRDSLRGESRMTVDAIRLCVCVECDIENYSSSFGVTDERKQRTEANVETK